MRIVFDPDFDSGCWPGPLGESDASAGEAWVGPGGLLGILETAVGLAGPPFSAAERAARLIAPLTSTEGFWSRSAEVDPFGSARRLLSWRDALVMCGWTGGGEAPRLAQISALMKQAPSGFPDRLVAVNAALARRNPGVRSLTLFAPPDDLARLWRATLRLLEGHGVRVEVSQPPPAAARGDLAAARAAGFVPQGDGSLRLLRPVGVLAAAEEVAAWLASLGNLRGTVVIGGDPALDAALRRHGLPTTGAAPSFRDGALLQVLPLVLELAWSPLDPQRALELLSLPASPLPRGLRYRLINALNAWPAVDSDAWRAALEEGVAELEPERRDAIRARLEVLWSAAVAHGTPCPTGEIARRANMLREWLYGHAALAPPDVADWRAAASQCDALLDLLDRAGQDAIPAAQLRRFVEEATRDSAVPSAWPAEAGLRAVGQPGAVVDPADRVVWWSFDEASVPGITRLPLSAAERTELATHGCELPDPGREAAAIARRWRRPLEQAAGSLLLVCAERDLVGKERYPHPLWDELLARVSSSDARRKADAMLRTASLADAVAPARHVSYAVQPLPAPKHTWGIKPGSIARREKEAPSSAETLLGCSFRWALQYPGQLRGLDSLSLPGPDDARLLGSLFHHILEHLVQKGDLTPEQAEQEATALIDREGPRLAAPLFLPGAEASRAAVRRTAGLAARELYRLMKDARVRVVASEKEYTGTALGTAFAGRPDIVLGDPVRIVDMKWGGGSWRLKQLANGTATQLASYSFLLRDGAKAQFPPVAYFILSEQRVLTTGPQSFPGAESVTGPGPDETWALLESSHAEHWKDVQQGTLRARGLPDDDGENPPKETKVVDGRLVLESPCKWCDFGGLCGLDQAGGA